ncbi:hypothetical protein OIO90_002817 [Microbotryomycetes sp. JL221]|nr:hypothetical protein OIO90_002817 [Microbotryomycetes sp. JL221]
MRARPSPNPERTPLFASLSPRSAATSSPLPPPLPSKTPWTPLDTFIPYFGAHTPQFSYTNVATPRRVRRRAARRTFTSTTLALGFVLTIVVLCRMAHHPEPRSFVKKVPGLRHLHRRAIMSWRDSLHAPPLFPLPANQIYIQDAVMNHTATVIFLHGMLLPATDNPLSILSLKYPNVRWVAPQAPARPIDVVTVKLRFEFPFTAWFNMRDTKTIHLTPSWEDEVGMVESQRQINELIRQEKSLFLQQGQEPNMVLAGFSQGSAMALLASLTAYEPPKGVMMFSGLVPLATKISNLNQFAQTDVPLFWGHGREDPVLYPEEAQVAYNWLKKGPVGLSDTQFKIYNGVDHGWGLQELIDSSDWLATNVPGLQQFS